MNEEPSKPLAKMNPAEKQAYEDQIRTTEAVSYLALGRIIEIF